MPLRFCSENPLRFIPAPSSVQPATLAGRAARVGFLLLHLPLHSKGNHVQQPSTISLKRLSVCDETRDP